MVKQEKEKKTFSHELQYYEWHNNYCITVTTSLNVPSPYIPAAEKTKMLEWRESDLKLSTQGRRFIVTLLLQS